MPTPKLTNVILEAAIEGLEAKKQRIDVQIAELRAMQTGSVEPSPAPAPVGKTGRKVSAAARKRMREAQKRRWAKIKEESPKATAKVSKTKRRLSAAGKANIIAATKKRWAEKRAAESQPVVKMAPRKKTS